MVLVVPPQQRQIVVPAPIPGRIAILVQALDFLLLRQYSADLFAHLPSIALAGDDVNHFAEPSQQVAHAFSLLQLLPGQFILGAPVRCRHTMNQHSGRSRRTSGLWHCESTTATGHTWLRGLHTIDYLKIGVEEAEYRGLRRFAEPMAAQKVHCLQFEYGALLRPRFARGLLFPSLVRDYHGDYHWTMENFRFSNLPSHSTD
jgi:hypothetical protein